MNCETFIVYIKSTIVFYSNSTIVFYLNSTIVLLKKYYRLT